MDLHHATLETNSSVVRQTIFGFWIANSNKIRPTGKTGLNKIDISCFGP
jgi:hypothetical protein